jgi:hypothetical protein
MALYKFEPYYNLSAQETVDWLLEHKQNEVDTYIGTRWVAIDGYYYYLKGGDSNEFIDDSVTHLSKKMYSYGWRRELKHEEIQAWLRNPLRAKYPWFKDWLLATIDNFNGDVDAINKHLWKTYRKQACIVKDDFGVIAHKKHVHRYGVYTLEGSQYKYVQATVKSIEDNTVSANGYTYLIEDELDRHLFNSVAIDDFSNTTLFSIITRDWQECEEHPGTIYLEREGCPK